MKENKIFISKGKSIEQINSIKLNEESAPKKENILLLNDQALKDFLPKNPNELSDSSGSLKNSLSFSKAQTKSRDFDKRYDKFGNVIAHGGQHKISFNKNFIEYINVENYKEYNKMEEITPKNMNGCCLLV